MRNLKNKKAFSLIELSIVLLIIGIIIAGITQSSRLISSFKLSTARSLTQSSPVYSISGVSAWYESTNINAIDVSDPDNNQAVTTWKDQNPQSSTKNDITQNGLIGIKPTYKTNQINSLPAIYFDGGDYLTLASVASSNFFPDPSQLTAFFVLNTNSSDYEVVIDFESPSTNRFSFLINITTGTPRFDFPNDSTGSLSGTGSLFNVTKVITLYKSAATQTIYVNGTSNATQNNALSLTPFIGNFNVGYYKTGALYVFGSIGEIIIYNRALKAEERQAIERYLGKKWGVTVS